MLKSEKQKLINKANKFDKIMARKVKTFLSKLSKDEIYDTLGDPYSLNAPSYYTSSKNFDGKGNFPMSYIQDFVRVHKSNFSSHKSTIYVQGKAVKSLKAVSNESIVWDLIYKFGLQKAFEEAGKYMGRGKSHRVLVSAIIDYIHPKKDILKQLSA
jgi:hypothetical protein